MKTARNAFTRLLGLFLLTLGGFSVAGAQVPVRVMPLGDSITAGFIPPSTYAGGYRERLYSLLTAPTEGFAVDYVGTLNYPGAVAEGWVDGDHEGHGGFKIQDIRSQLPIWLKQIPDPDVILLKIGTNDFWSGENVSTTQDRLRSLIADLSALRPHARIIVASLIRRTDAIEATQAQFNASLPAIVAAQAALGRKVTYVNMHAGFGSDPADISEDGVHPTATGHSKIGDVWLPAIKSVITPLGTNAPPAIASVTAFEDLQHVKVTFSKPINDTDGANPANFSLSDGVSISQASLDASKRVVTLNTGTQLAAKLHTLTVSGVRDRLVLSNLIAPASTATFTSRAFIDGSFEQNDSAWVKQGTVSVQDATLQRATDGQKIVVFSGAEGSNDGVISQSIPTIPNQKYRLQFDMGVYTSVTSSQSLQLTVRDDVGGASGQILLSPPVTSLDVVNTTGIPTTSWRILTYEFTAISASTTIRFSDASTVTSSVDLLLDDVRLDAVTNDAPVAMNDGGIGAPFLTVAANSGASTPIAVLANDTDSDNDPLTVTAAASPNGTVSIIGGQTMRFTPTLGFSGEATVTYTISDGKGGTSSATVWISVLVVGPFGNGSFENGTPVDFGIPINWDAAGSVISYSSKGFYVPASGKGVWMVVFNAGNNERVNRLWQTFSTVVGQTYTVTFDAGLAAYEGQIPRMQVVAAEVSGEVSPIPPGPRSWEILSDGPTATWSEKSFTFTAGSSATTLTFTVDITGPPGPGGEPTVLDNAEGVDLVLDDVRVTAVGGTNQAPVAANDDFSTPAGLTLTVAAPGVLENDTDDSGPLIAVVDSQPNQGGSLTLNANGSFSYTPVVGFTGIETFTYRAFDGLLLSAVTTVEIDVTQVGPFANGSFEDSSVIWTAPRSWTATGVVTYFDANYQPAANNGTWMAVFNPSNETPLVSTLSQTFQTVAGQPYKVQFDAGMAGQSGKAQTLQAAIGGTTLFSQQFTSSGPAADWTQNLSFNFTATGPVTTLTFTVDITGQTAAQSVDLLLDDVRITEVSTVNEAPVAAVESYSVQTGSTLTVSAPGVLDNDDDSDEGPAALTAVLDTPLNHGGQLTLNPDGSFSYTPATGFTGEETFSYHAFDGALSSAPVTVTLTVTPVGPFANGSFEVAEPEPAGSLQGWSATGVITYVDETNYLPAAGNGGWMAVFNPGNDTPDVSTLSQNFATVVGQLYKVQFDAGMAGQSGKAQTLQAAIGGTTLFSQQFTSSGPAADWTQNLSFNFTATGPVTTLTFTVDITGQTTAQSVDLLLDDVRITEVSTINEAPVAAVESYSVQTGSTLTVSAPGVLDNDDDNDDGPAALTAVLDTPLNHGGQLTLNPDGSFSYTPATGFTGEETFSYHAFDGALPSAPVTVTLTVTPVGPFANGSFEVAESTPAGSLQGWSATGVITYVDETNYLPAAGNGGWMAVFNPGNDTPDVSSLSQNFATVVGQLYKVQFDAGMAGQSGKAQTLQAAIGGTTLFSQQFTSSGPAADWTQNLSFNFTATGPVTTLTFTVDITGQTAAQSVDLLLDDVRITEVSTINEAPVAAVESYSVQTGSTLTVSAPGVLDNDDDSDEGPAALTAVLDTPLNHGGQLTLNPDGSFSYTPATGFTGEETFSYHAFDGALSSAPVTVTLTVTPVGPFANGSFETAAVLGTAPQNWTATGVITYADGDNYLPDTGNGSWMAVFNPGGNTPLVSALSQTFATVPGQVYTVAFDTGLAGGAGNKQQTLQATVTGESAPPPTRSWPITSSDPLASWSEKSFNFTAGGTSATLTFSVDITAAGPAFDVDLLLDEVRITVDGDTNQYPIAVNDGSSGTPFVTLAEDSGVSAPMAVLINDSDPNSDPLTVIQASSLNGAVVINGGQTLTFNPTSNYNGTATISYTISDGQGGTASAVVFVLVTPVNDPPVAVNEGSAGNPFLTVAEDSGASAPINVLANDMDIDLNPLTVTSASSLNGTVIVNPNQTLSFSPSLNFNGPTTISYTISDAKGGTASATMFVSVTPVNDVPVANAQTVSVNEDGSIAITLTGSDADGNSLTFAVGSAAHGSVSLSEAVATYTPETNYSGPDSFTFTTSDGIAVSTSATVSITVIGLGGSNFNQWLAAHLLSAGVGADSDGDSVSNAVEYVIGGDPKTQMDAAMLPTISRVSAVVGGNTVPADYLLFTYRRTDRAKNDPSTAIKVEWNNGLSGTWTDAAGSPGVVVVGENDGFAPGVDRIKVYLPLSLAVGGKFFTRLGVDISGTEPDE